MQETIEVITIHGAGPHDDTFSQALERNVIDFLKKNGVSSAEEIVHFTPVVWSDIGRETKEELRKEDSASHHQPLRVPSHQGVLP